MSIRPRRIGCQYGMIGVNNHLRYFGYFSTHAALSLRYLPWDAGIAKGEGCQGNVF